MSTLRLKSPLPARPSLKGKPARDAQRAYALLVAHGKEYGNDEGLDEAMELVRSLLSPTQQEEIHAQLREEYAGSGMEMDDE